MSAIVDGWSDTDRSVREKSFHDLGSSISIVFTPDFQEIVVGLSKKEGKEVFKHPCGKIEHEDVPAVVYLSEDKLLDLTAENCARRELFRETGIDTRYLEYTKLTYVRALKGKTSSKQHHFVVILPKRVTLSREITEHEEMHPPEYWRVTTALKGGGMGKKLNPYHQLALCKCIQELSALGLGSDPHFPGFRQLLENIYDAEIDIDAHTLNLQGMLENREI